MTLLRNIRKLNLCVLLLLSSFTGFSQSYEIQEVPINSRQSDFGAVRFENGLVFCSSRHQRRMAGDIDSSHFYTDMFVSYLDIRRHFDAPQLLSSELTTILNEGPATFTSDFNTIYYTANIPPQNKKEAEELVYPLGVFSAKRIHGKWISQEPFAYNSNNSSYDIAHPALSPDNLTLYFTSNMEGGYGGSDIYRCKWTETGWSEPENLGPEINTEGNEVFPYQSKTGMFFFSTNGRNGELRTDMDIFSTRMTADGKWMEPKALPEPLNSPFNDYTYCEFNNENFGFISSDRNQGDNIYSFSKSIPQFYDCLENQRTVLCYLIEDSKLEKLDNTPLEYQWDLGDGTLAKGFSVEHCYRDTGVYHIKLHIKDSITDQYIMNVSETTLEIFDYEQPYILSNDSVKAGVPLRFFSDDSPIRKYKTEKHYWIIDNDKIFTGDTLEYTFETTGYHTVLCGAVSAPLPGGEVLKTCSYKEIFVFGDDLPGFPQMDPDPSVEPIQKIKLRTEIPDLTESSLKSKMLYRIVLEKSRQRLPMNYAGFAKVQEEIVETKDTSGVFTYSVGISAELSRLYNRFKELQDRMDKTLTIETFNQENFGKEYMRTGTYIAQGNAEKLNVEFNRLKDIKFEYNSAAIREESLDNLDYIVAMLKLENDFTLRINAHTCSQGSHEYNLQLSERRAESVRKYFISKGIQPRRLITKGYAETQPIADNSTEEGKAQNRRVEFIILFNQENHE